MNRHVFYSTISSGFLSFICPKYLILFLEIHIFSSFSFNLVLNPSVNHENISHCVLLGFHFSAKYRPDKRSPLSIVSITCWTIAGVNFIPKANRLFLYIPRIVFIVSNLEHSLSTSISWYESLRSIFENIWPPLSCAKTSSSPGSA